MVHKNNNVNQQSLVFSTFYLRREERERASERERERAEYSTPNIKMVGPLCTPRDYLALTIRKKEKDASLFIFLFFYKKKH